MKSGDLTGVTEQPQVAQGTGLRESGRSGSRSGAADKAVRQAMSHLWALVFLSNGVSELGHFQLCHYTIFVKVASRTDPAR